MKKLISMVIPSYNEQDNKERGVGLSLYIFGLHVYRPTLSLILSVQSIRLKV